ncbi:hypothetical protein B296_00001990 [Ensete ventricosum]|uniref:Uncharacterized protein n=1 Tax=Ensete ventricosum TaxID=4639 RepID=A0A427A4V1_ENSVE|nr:hypothetical protein B296_00001990 [Ensete ventricosum]
MLSSHFFAQVNRTGPGLDTYDTHPVGAHCASPDNGHPFPVGQSNWRTVLGTTTAFQKPRHVTGDDKTWTSVSSRIQRRGCAATTDGRLRRRRVAAGGQSSKSGARPRPEKRASSFSPLPSSAAPRFASLSSAHILRFLPNFVRQLSTKARRNCRNIGVAQAVAASWSNSSPAFEAPGPRPPRTPPSPPTSQRMTSQSSPVESPFPSAGEAKASAKAVAKAASSLISDGSLAVHAGD